MPMHDDIVPSLKVETPRWTYSNVVCSECLSCWFGSISEETHIFHKLLVRNWCEKWSLGLPCSVIAIKSPLFVFLPGKSMQSWIKMASMFENSLRSWSFLIKFTFSDKDRRELTVGSDEKTQRSPAGIKPGSSDCRFKDPGLISGGGGGGGGGCAVLFRLIQLSVLLFLLEKREENLIRPQCSFRSWPAVQPGVTLLGHMHSRSARTLFAVVVRRFAHLAPLSLLTSRSIAQPTYYDPLTIKKLYFALNFCWLQKNRAVFR